MGEEFLHLILLILRNKCICHISSNLILNLSRNFEIIQTSISSVQILIKL